MVSFIFGGKTYLNYPFIRWGEGASLIIIHSLEGPGELTESRLNVLSMRYLFTLFHHANQAERIGKGRGRLPMQSGSVFERSEGSTPSSPSSSPSFYTIISPSALTSPNTPTGLTLLWLYRHPYVWGYLSPFSFSTYFIIVQDCGVSPPYKLE